MRGRQGGVESEPLPQIPLKLLLSPLNQNENQPDAVGPRRANLVVVRNLPFSVMPGVADDRGTRLRALHFSDETPGFPRR